MAVILRASNHRMYGGKVLMKVGIECIPCYFKQATSAMKHAGVPETRQIEVLYSLMDTIKGFDVKRSPAENSSLIVHEVARLIGIEDPFEKAKRESNQAAVELVERVLKERVRTDSDPLFAAVRASVAGNVVDLGILESYDLDAALDEAFNVDFAKCDYAEFSKCLKSVRHLLYLGDNSGEIAFDRLFVEELCKLGVDVTFAVKAGPALNDATLEDAAFVGMDEVANVITTGSNFLGVIEERCSEEFLKVFNEAELVIAKGQANYESLEGTELAGDKTFFILKMKCPLVADTLGVQLGDLVFCRA